MGVSATFRGGDAESHDRFLGTGLGNDSPHGFTALPRLTNDDDVSGGLLSSIHNKLGKLTQSAQQRHSDTPRSVQQGEPRFAESSRLTNGTSKPGNLAEELLTALFDSSSCRRHTASSAMTTQIAREETTWPRTCT